MTQTTKIQNCVLHSHGKRADVCLSNSSYSRSGSGLPFATFIRSTMLTPHFPARSGAEWTEAIYRYGCFWKSWYPPIIHLNRVFHYFHHPFWGTPIFGNTHIVTVMKGRQPVKARRKYTKKKLEHRTQSTRSTNMSGKLGLVLVFKKNIQSQRIYPNSNDMMGRFAWVVEAKRTGKTRWTLVAWRLTVQDT